MIDTLRWQGNDAVATMVREAGFAGPIFGYTGASPPSPICSRLSLSPPQFASWFSSPDAMPRLFIPSGREMCGGHVDE
jgi:hypothetical protein